MRSLSQLDLMILGLIDIVSGACLFLSLGYYKPMWDLQFISWRHGDLE